MRQFWRLKGVFSTRRLALMGLFVALTAVLAPILNVYLTPQIRLFSFTYLPGALAAMLFGPWAGLLVGFGGDFATWLFTPNNGAYFPGFALSAMLANLIYAAFLFRRTETPPQPARVLIRILLAQAAVLILITSGLNMLWLNVMYGQAAGEFYAGWRVVLRLAQYPIDAGLLFGLYYLRRRLPLPVLQGD